jgi:hypothetical protein
MGAPMTQEITLEATFSGADREAIARSLVDVGLGGAAQVKVMRTPVVRLVRPGHALDVPSLIDTLARVPFQLATFRALFPEWNLPDAPLAPPPFGFADGHYFHGWACVFRGDGHDRLVSRRWLPHGPWKLHIGPNDTSLVQFHALDADAATARAQCIVGHRRMGGSEEGGFIQSNPPLPERAPGDYVPGTRRLRIPIYGRGVTQREMLDARMIVKLQALGAGKPLDAATFAFADEAEARPHLHELWLRELECVTFLGGVETDLTRTYQPEPTPPDWAR